MIPVAHEAPLPSSVLNALEVALDQSHEVKAKVEACADDVATANELVKERIGDGHTMVPATQTLESGLAVEAQVQECADDLKEVTDNLEQGVDQVKGVERALQLSREALRESEAALAISLEAEHSASWRAMHDHKTGLPNRVLFDDRLAQAISGAERHGWMLAVMFLDLDRFKAINDTHGHAAGDTVLTIVAERLRSQARDEDTVCRNGGDEFLYLLIDPAGRDNVARIAGLVRAALALPIPIGDLQVTVTPSIGISLYPDHGAGADQLVAHADAAMYQSKQRHSGWAFFEPPAA